jgi:hypothetical protein
VGLHYESDPFAEQLRFRPNLEVGVGSSQTLIALNFEFAYYIPVDTGRRRGVRPWSVYVGAGPAGHRRVWPNNTNTGGGFNILIGAAHRRLFTELKVGMIDSPTKFGVGYTFRP